jgi:pimeloyl-ACP methyl ester carboxylesterase
MPTITLPGGVQFYYRRRAGGNRLAPLVLVHGAGGNHMHWPAELRCLPDAVVYSLDLPGHGKSDGPGLADIGAYAETVHAFVSALGLARFVLAGHSMGGAIALEYALHYAPELAGLVLVNTGGRLRVPPQILTGLHTDFERIIEQLARRTHAEDADLPLLRQYVRRLREVAPEVLYGDFIACDRFDRLTDLTRVSVPTLVLCGEADRMTPAEYSRALAERIPGAHLAVIPAGSHMVMLERPAEVAGLLARWLVTRGVC